MLGYALSTKGQKQREDEIMINIYAIRSESGTGTVQYVTPSLTYTRHTMFAKCFTSYREARDYQKTYETGGYVIKL